MALLPAPRDGARLGPRARRRLSGSPRTGAPRSLRRRSDRCTPVGIRAGAARSATNRATMHDRVGNTQTGFGHHRHGRDIGRTGRRTAPARVLAAALLLAAPGRLDAARDWLERVFWAARRLATWSDTPAPNPKLFTDLWLDAQHLGLNAQDGLLNLAKAVTQGGQHLQLARQDAARMLRDVAAIGYGFVSGVPEADGLTLPAGGDSAGRL